MSTGLQINEGNAFILAQEINTIQEQTNKILIQSAIEIGKRLKEAKELVGHGNWGNWLEQSVSYSQKTASNLIKIYEEYGEKYLIEAENSNSKLISNLGYTQALAMLKLDPEERENFLEENDVLAMTTKELEQAIAEKKAIQEQKDKLLEQVDKLYADNEDLKKKSVAAEDLQKKIDEYKKNNVDPKQVKKLEDERDKAIRDKEKLEKELKEANSKTTTVEVEKEVIPEAVVEEMEKMRTKLAMGENTIKFKATLDVLVNIFNELLVTLANIKETDPAVHDRYKEAVNKVLDQFRQ